MSFSFKTYMKHFLAVVIFSVISLAYFNPVLSGKAIFQNDIKQYIGMSKQQKDFRLANDELVMLFRVIKEVEHHHRDGDQSFTALLI